MTTLELVLEQICGDAPQFLHITAGKPHWGQRDDFLQHEPLDPVLVWREWDLHKELLLKRTVTVDVSEEGSPHKNQAEGGFGRYGTPGVGIWQTDPKRILWRNILERISTQVPAAFTYEACGSTYKNKKPPKNDIIDVMGIKQIFYFR